MATLERHKRGNIDMCVVTFVFKQINGKIRLVTIGILSVSFCKM